jgi:hypothetical protein
MRSLYIALIALVLGFAASCAGSAVADLDQAADKQVLSIDTGTDNPDYIFWDCEGEDEIE